MIILYHSGGARDFELLKHALPENDWQKSRNQVKELLKARKHDTALNILLNINFELFEATNYFQDDFYVLFYSVPVNEYVEIEKGVTFDEDIAYTQIADAFVNRGLFLRFIAVDIADNPEITPVANPTPKFTSSVVNRAINDAELLIKQSGAISAVDRIHTAIHGYLQVVCTDSAIDFPKDSNITQLYKLLRENHPALNQVSPIDENTNRILRAISTIIDTVNFLRNRASVAHPNDVLLEEAEAMLVVNSVRTILNYLDSKIANYTT